MRRTGGDLGISTRGGQSLFRQHRIVIAMNQVVRHSGMMRLLLKNWLQNFTTLTLIGKRLVSFRSADVQGQSVKDRGLAVGGVLGVESRQLLLRSEERRVGKEWRDRWG